MNRRSGIALCFLLLLGGCGPSETTDPDSGTPGTDAGPGVDSGPGADSGPTPGVDGGPGVDAGPGPGLGWAPITLPADHVGQRVTGIHCTAANACVITTDGVEPGMVFAANATAVTTTLVDGSTLSELAHVLGDVHFIGLDTSRLGLTARLDVSGATVSATGDFSNPSSWTAVDLGRVDGEPFALNAQEALQSSAEGRWLFYNTRGYVYEADAPPSATTVWSRLWSPTAVPPVPSDFPARHAADPTLCDSEVSTGVSPDATQNVYLSHDLTLAIHPAGGINQNGSATEGVCISIDGGDTYYNVAFPDLGGARGPIAVTCIDGERCFAYNGLQFESDSAYVYMTTNASAGRDSTWTRATVPSDWAGSSGIQPRHMFFAPDGTHGWLAGSRDNQPMLLRTTDAGATWTNLTAVRAAASSRLHVGFALDANRIWVGGENGTFLTNGRAGD